jgi:hypothetical protein
VTKAARAAIAGVIRKDEGSPHEIIVCELYISESTFAAFFGQGARAGARGCTE